MNFILRDKENYNFPSLNATIQFVEIACHERLSSTLKDAKKFQDSLAFNAQLAALQKVMLGIHMNKKILPYKDSKLTKIMQNYCNVNSEVTVMCHAISNPREFIACLSYLQLVSRFRSEKKEKDLVAEVQRVAGDLKGEQVASNLTPAEEKELRHRLDTIRELDSRFDFMKKEYRSNMAKIGSIIGAKENLESLIYKRASPFWHEFKDNSSLLQRIALKDQSLIEKDTMIIRTQKKIEDLKRELTERLEAHIVNTYQLQDEISYVRDKSNITRNNISNNGNELVSQKYDKLRQLAVNNQALLSEKTSTTSKFPTRMMNFDEPAKTQTMESIKQQALQLQRAKNDDILQSMKDQNEKLIQTKCKEYQDILAARNKDCDTFMAKCNEKKIRKKKVEKELESEMVNLYQFLKRQAKIIYNIKNDSYNKGHETINIPTEYIDQMHMPTRDKQPQLFRVLDKMKIVETKTISGEGKRDETMASFVEDVKQSITRTLQKPTEDKTISDKEIDIKNIDLTKMTAKQLTDTLKKLNDQAAMQRERIKLLAEKIDLEYGGEQIAEVEGVLEDIEYYKAKIEKEKKKTSQLKSSLGSQNRLLAKEQTRIFLEGST